MNINRRLALQIAIYGVIFFLFCYFRLKPIYLQTVGYTYDQGRDFLKAGEIVLYKNPTFIGPTTGIMGVYHGAWWYYLLSLNFMITKGIPISFYYFNFVIQAISFGIFIIFTKKYFNFLTSAILSFFIATSPFFIFDTIFIGNNVMALPAFLALIIATLMLVDKRKVVKIPKIPVGISLFFLAGLALGLVSEFEFAFGLMLIPVYFVLMFLINWYKKLFTRWPEYLYFLIGLGIAFAPRALFELKNGFTQTKVLLNFVLHPKYFTPKPYDDIFRDRVQMFEGYFNGLFMSDLVKSIMIGFLIAFVALRVYKKEFKITFSFIVMIILGIALFLVSTFYKDTFWSYYYDGIQYLFIFVAGFIFTFQSKKNDSLRNRGKIVLLVLLLFLGLGKVFTDLESQYVYDGIRVQQDIVNYIQDEEKGQKEYCVQIYTPPVIPYTYDYLFLYHEVNDDIPKPTMDFKNNHCWFVLEKDDYKERKQKWIDDHIPHKAKRVSIKQIKDVTVEKWAL